MDKSLSFNIFLGIFNECSFIIGHVKSSKFLSSNIKYSVLHFT